MTSIAFTMSLQASIDGTLRAEVAPPDEGARFEVTRALLILRLWRESADVIRCSLHHPISGAIAYVQGNNALAELSEAIELHLHGE